MLSFVSQVSRALSNVLTLSGGPPDEFVRLKLLCRLLWSRGVTRRYLCNFFELWLFNTKTNTNTDTDTDTNP